MQSGIGKVTESTQRTARSGGRGRLIPPLGPRPEAPAALRLGLGVVRAAPAAMRNTRTERSLTVRRSPPRPRPRIHPTEPSDRVVPRRTAVLGSRSIRLVSSGSIEPLALPSTPMVAIVTPVPKRVAAIITSSDAAAVVSRLT